MASKVFTLYGSIRADDKGLKKDLDSAHQKVGRAANKMRNTLDSAAKKMGRAFGIALVAGAAVAVYEMQKIGKEAIKAASNLEEVTSKFNTVFKGQEVVAKQWSKTLVESYAMSTRESKQFLSSIQDLLVPMGMNAKEAGNMSFEVVKLAADLASFNNLPTADVMIDIQSALVGNFETMKKYGVILNETVIKQEALNMGLWDGKGMVDANTKAQVAYKLMLEGSTAAIGDQIRTMDGYANQVKSLGASWEDLMAAIGDKFLPVATQAVSMINLWIKANKDLIATNIGNVASQWADGLVWVLETMQGIVKVIGFMAKSWDALVVAGNAAIFGIVAGLEKLMFAVEAVLMHVEVLAHGLVMLGILDVNPVTAAIAKINDTLKELKITTAQVLDDSMDKLIKTTAKYDAMDVGIEKVIEDVKGLGQAYENLGAIADLESITDEITKGFAETNEEAKKVETTVMKIIGYLNGMPVEARVKITADDKVTPKTKEIIKDLSAITGKKVKGFSESWRVGPAEGLGRATTNYESAWGEGSGDGHKSKIDVTGNANKKISEIKTKLDDIKEPVKTKVSVDARAGIKALEKVKEYHEELNGKVTKSTHIVTTVYKGKGSTETSLSEKVKEVNTMLDSTRENAEKGAVYTVDFRGRGSEVKPLKAKVNDVIGWIKDVGNFLSKKYSFDIDFGPITSLIEQMVQLLSVMNNTADAARDVYRTVSQISRSGMLSIYDYNKYGRVVGVTQHFDSGGSIPGYGGGDTVPAMLEPGEFVINKKSAAAIGSNKLHQMNKMAEGGEVPRLGLKRTWMTDDWGTKDFVSQRYDDYKEQGSAFITWLEFLATNRQTPVQNAWQYVYDSPAFVKTAETLSDFLQTSVGGGISKLKSSTKTALRTRDPYDRVSVMDAVGNLSHLLEVDTIKATRRYADSYATGTGPQGLPKTGMFWGHKGEIVKSPEESDKERKGKSGNVYNINISPGMMTGDKSTARQMAITIHRELKELNSRYA